MRPPEETVGSPDSQTDNATKAYISEEFSAVYKKYTIWRKTNMMGRQERILAVDGDYIYILPSEQKNFFDNLKTISFHISSVLSCLQSKKSSPTFKISFQKDRETKVYEFDAVNPQEAGI